jgi:hypothetical protein
MEEGKKGMLASRRFAILTSAVAAWSLDCLIGIPESESHEGRIRQ